MVVECISTSFLFIAKYYSSLWMYHILFIRSSFNGHLGCSHFLTIVNNAGSLTKSWNFIMRGFASMLLVD